MIHILTFVTVGFIVAWFLNIDINSMLTIAMVLILPVAFYLKAVGVLLMEAMVIFTIIMLIHMLIMMTVHTLANRLFIMDTK